MVHFHDICSGPTQRPVAETRNRRHPCCREAYQREREKKKGSKKSTDRPVAQTPTERPFTKRKSSESRFARKSKERNVVKAVPTGKAVGKKPTGRLVTKKLS